MKKTTLHFLQILLLSCFCATPSTWSADEPIADTEAGIAVDADLEAEREVLQSQLDALNRDIDELQALSLQVDNLPKQDREAVLFRVDERSFQVFRALDQLTRLAEQLPAEDAQRIEIERRLRENLTGAGDAAFARIDSLDTRIIGFRSDVESLSRQNGLPAKPISTASNYCVFNTMKYWSM